MLARLQQLTTIGLLLAAFVWAAYFLTNGSPGWAAVGALLIVLGYSLVLAAEFITLWFVNRNDPAPRATLWQHIRAWWGEVVTTPQVFCWRQPFCANAVADYLPQGADQRGVLFVHGFLCNRGLWNPHMRMLRGQGIPSVAVNLEPVFGSIDSYADLVEKAVRRIKAATGQPPVIVAHSMGGLAVRVWLDAYQGDGHAHRIITIGTPHRGTFLGKYAFSPNAKQMNLSSDWQRRLAAREPAHRFNCFTCFYGHCDNIVFPASTAMLPGADNRHIAAIAHVHMAHHDEVFNELLRWVRSTSDVGRADIEPGLGTQGTAASSDGHTGGPPDLAASKLATHRLLHDDTASSSDDHAGADHMSRRG
jgi:triacylglycerol lipase